DGDPREGAVAFGERLEHRDALGADGQAVGGVLDVAAADDRAVGGLEGGADLELRERRVGELARPPRGGDEIDLAGTIAQAPRREAAIATLAPLDAVGRAGVPGTAIESGAAIGLDARPALVDHQPERIRPPHTVHDVRDARDLVEARRERLDLGIA